MESHGESQWLLTVNILQRPAKKARAEDKDVTWTELPDDPTWNPDSGLGGWAFLDPTSFRYYLPAAMVVIIRQDSDGLFLFDTSITSSDRRASLLNLRQKMCVKRFLQYMGVSRGFAYMQIKEFGWISALNSSWGQTRNDSPDH